MAFNSENKFMCHNGDKLLKEVQVQICKTLKRQVPYYNKRRRTMKIKVGDFDLLKKHCPRVCREKRVATFCPKFVGSFEFLDAGNNKLIMDVEEEMTTTDLDQARVYTFRNDRSPHKYGAVISNFLYRHSLQVLFSVSS